MTTLVDEMLASGRGMWALLRGDRSSAKYFDLSLRGLVGSVIVFLIVSVASAYLPLLAGGQMAPGGLARSLIILCIPVVAQVGISWLALRQIKRLDAFVPYLVADNWLTIYGMLVSGLFLVTGLGVDLALLAVGIVSLIIKINYSRLILTLSGWQIAMFLVAQLVGGAVGLLLMAPFLPLPPEVTG